MIRQCIGAILLIASANSFAANKGSLNVSPDFNWSNKTPAIKTNWSLNHSKHLWGINNSGSRFKLCWRKKSQTGDACWYNKAFYGDAAYGAVLSNLSSNTNYRVKLEAFGKKKNAFPTSFFRWHVIGRKDIRTNKVTACNRVVKWWNNNSKKGSFDGAHCYVYKIPTGLKPFVWNNNYYVKASSPGQCAIGNWDTANCWVGEPPSNTKAFLYSGNFYYSE